MGGSIKGSSTTTDKELSFDVTTSSAPSNKRALDVSVVSTVGGGGGGVDPVGLKNASSTTINPATEDGNLATIAGDTTSLDTKVTKADTDDVTITSSVLPTGAATAANQLADGHNVTVDNAAGASAVNIQDGGNSITVDGTVSISSGTVTIQEPLSIDDNGGSLTIDATSLPLPTGAATASNQTTGNASLSTIAGDTTSLDGKVTACNTGNVTISSSALPTGAATSANQLPDGHNVTIDNASGASAVNIQDGGNSITIDAATLPLPTGAATEATLSNVQTEVAGIHTKIDATSTSSQNIQGGVAVGGAATTNPVPVGLRDLTGAIIMPAANNLGGGIGLPYMTMLDAGFRTPTFTSAGEILALNNVNSTTATPTNINTTYNNVTTTATSAGIACDNYSRGKFSFTLAKANTPTDIRIYIEESDDNTNFFPMTNGGLGLWVYDDTAVGSGISRSYLFAINSEYLRVRIVATGTTASATFTMSNGRVRFMN